jgi:ribosomal protein L7/L12
MATKPTYNELERKIKQLEKEVLEYVRKAKELDKKRKVTEHSHIRRTISLMHINEELNREIKELKRSDTEELGLVSHRLRERIKELNCLYDISSFRDAADFSLDAVLQAVVDFIPPAIQYPEITCARLIFGGYEVTTKNFKDTRWKLSREITVNNKWIGTLEVCYLEEEPELDEGPFLKEAKDLINAVAENIEKIIEREEAEAAIRKHEDHIEALIRKAAKKVTHI